jgi:hypothetical protein
MAFGHAAESRRDIVRRIFKLEGAQGQVQRFRCTLRTV